LNSVRMVSAQASEKVSARRRFLRLTDQDRQEANRMIWLAVSFLIFVTPASDESAAVPGCSTWLFDRTADAKILSPEKK
jgi:hypothetical protein